MTNNIDMDILRNSLPSGLTQWKIANEVEQYQQRCNYEIYTPSFSLQSLPVDREDVTVREPRKKRVPSMLQQLCKEVDDIYATCPPHMQRSTEGYLKQKLLEFAMAEHGNIVLGPKKCRELVAYVGTPMVVKNEPFLLLCSFLLDAKIAIDHQIYTWNHQPYTKQVNFECKN